MCCSRHGIGVDLDSGNEVCISPVMSLGRCSTQFDVHAALHQISNEVPVGIAGGNITVGVISRVMQRHVACIGVKDRHDLGLGLPVGDVVHDEVKMKDGRGQIAFER